MRKHKQHILYIIVILLSLVSVINTNNTSALLYQSNVGVGFAFNPTLSVSLSSSDLVIANLVPGNTLDSNIINVSVASNAAYGYTLSAMANGNNSNLTHSNGTNTFSSIATNADLSDLEDSEDTNIWGYSYKDNTVETPAWSNYNGLSSSNSTSLINTNDNIPSNLDFKIAAKASSTQPSGEYTSTINFIAVSKVAPMSLLDSFIASGAEQLNGYYKMQDMTHDICNNVDIEESELQLIDVRDNKVYWVAKLKDGNCWMTQNLDFDLSHEVALTSETSDIDPDSYGKTIYTAEAGYSKDDETNVVSWLPSTIDSNGTQRANTINIIWNGDNATIPNWDSNYNSPYSANPGNRYKYANSSLVENSYTSFEDCVENNNNNTTGCQHGHYGNYYNWPAAIASNNAINTSGNQKNSICPKSWKLPIPNEYENILKAQNVWTGSSNTYTENGFNNIRISPLYFAQFGSIVNKDYYPKAGSRYWSSSVLDAYYARFMTFNSSNIWPINHDSRFIGSSLRCLAR